MLHNTVFLGWNKIIVHTFFNLQCWFRSLLLTNLYQQPVPVWTHHGGKQPSTTVCCLLTAKTQTDTNQIKVTHTPLIHCRNLVHLTSNPFKIELGGSQTTPYFVEWIRYRKPSKMDLPYPKFCGCISQKQHQLLLSCVLPPVQPLETFPKVSPHQSNYRHSVSQRRVKKKINPILFSSVLEQVSANTEPCLLLFTLWKFWVE